MLARSLPAMWQASRDLGGPPRQAYLIISPAGLTRYQTPPTP